MCHNYLSVIQVRKYKGMMLEDLENALAEHAPAGGELASELPPLTIDGIPVSVDKMTQVRLSTLSIMVQTYQVRTTVYIIQHQGDSSLQKLMNSKLPCDVGGKQQRAPVGNKSESLIVSLLTARA